MKVRSLAKLMTFVFVLSLFLCIGFVVIARTQEFKDFTSLYSRNGPFDVAYAFASALRLNNNVAYEVASPDLRPRIDKWMQTHEVRKCRRSNDELIQWGRAVRFTIDFLCYLEGGGLYEFTVHDIIVENGDTVVDWGEINEVVDARYK
jgi:hypothetical protein